MRDERLKGHLFVSMSHARALIAAWRTDFNAARPHSKPGCMTPAAYAASLESQWPSALSQTENRTPMAIAQTAQTRLSRPMIPGAGV